MMNDKKQKIIRTVENLKIKILCKYSAEHEECIIHEVSSGTFVLRSLRQFRECPEFTMKTFEMKKVIYGEQMTVYGNPSSL